MPDELLLLLEKVEKEKAEQPTTTPSSSLVSPPLPAKHLFFLAIKIMNSINPFVVNIFIELQMQLPLQQGNRSRIVKMEVLSLLPISATHLSGIDIER